MAWRRGGEGASVDAGDAGAGAAWRFPPCRDRKIDMRDFPSHPPVRRGLVAGFVLAAALAVFFGVRLFHGASLWDQAPPQDPVIAGWMTPRFVMRAWDTPPEVIAEALNLDQDGIGRRMTLAELAKDRGDTTDALIADLEAAIAAFRAGQ